VCCLCVTATTFHSESTVHRGRFSTVTWRYSASLVVAAMGTVKAATGMLGDDNNVPLFDEEPRRRYAQSTAQASALLQRLWPRRMMTITHLLCCRHKKLGDSPDNLLINQGLMAALQELRQGYHSRAGLEPGTSRFLTLPMNHYAARGMYLSS
jgi:hypothetical protein